MVGGLLCPDGPATVVLRFVSSFSLFEDRGGSSAFTGPSVRNRGLQGPFGMLVIQKTARSR